MSRGQREGHLHNQLREHVRAEAPGVQAERRAVVLAGPPGAGKSVAIDRLLDTDAERATYLKVDADDFKRLLLESSLEDGTFEAWLKPSEVARLEAAGERFFPLEFVSLVHEESSLLAAELRNESIARGTNLVIDGVLASKEKALRLGEQLEAADYAVWVVDVEVPFEISEQGIRGRWREAYEDAISGKDPMSGRWVPGDYARGVFDGLAGKSKPEHAARALADGCGVVMDYQLHRVDAAHFDATGERIYQLEVELRRRARGSLLAAVVQA